MKKLILAALAMGMAGSLLAQGTVNFSSATGSGVTARVYTNNTPTGVADSAHLAQGSSTPYHVALYWGAAGSTEAQLVSIYDGVATTAAGKFNIGVATTGAATAPGATGVFQVRGWTGNYASYDLAMTAALGGDTSVLIGKTGLFNNATGGVGQPATLPANLTGFVAGNDLFLLSPVPEPSTIALAGLGAASLLLFRRRK